MYIISQWRRARVHILESQKSETEMTASVFHHLTVVFKMSFRSDKGDYPNNLHGVFYPKSVLLNLVCVWILKAKVESKAQSSVVTKWIGGH